MGAQRIRHYPEELWILEGSWRKVKEFRRYLSGILQKGAFGSGKGGRLPAGIFFKALIISTLWCVGSIGPDRD